MMFGQAFVVNALIAGSLLGVASGLVGSFLVRRGEVFAGDALSHVAFTGAVGAAALGLDLRLGLLLTTLAAAVGFAVLGGRARAQDATIGIVLAWVLGIGVLALDALNGGSGGGDGVTATRTLFGSLFALDGTTTWTAAVAGAVVSIVVLVIGRPLLFASVDPLVAAVAGVRTRLVGTTLLVALALVAAEATEAIGALLLLGLLTAPALAAQRLTRRPYRALVLAAVFALAAVWIGVVLAYHVSSLPPSTAIVLAATALLAGATAIPIAARHWRAARARGRIAR